MTLEQLKPQLLAAGLDVDAVLAAVGPVITPDDLATLAQIAAQPIPLQYVLSFEGTAGVETTTGAEVDVGAIEWVGAKPVLADVAMLQAVLIHYPDVPEAVAAVEALTTLSSAPAVKLFEYHYEQTPASVADIADEVKSMRNQIRLAKLYVPFGLLGAAALSLLVGAFVVHDAVAIRRSTCASRPLPPNRHPNGNRCRAEPPGELGNQRGDANHARSHRSDHGAASCSPPTSCSRSSNAPRTIPAGRLPPTATATSTST